MSSQSFILNKWVHLTTEIPKEVEEDKQQEIGIETCQDLTIKLVKQLIWYPRSKEFPSNLEEIQTLVELKSHGKEDSHQTSWIQAVHFTSSNLCKIVTSKDLLLKAKEKEKAHLVNLLRNWQIQKTQLR